jgi:hypothetical protein
VLRHCTGFRVEGPAGRHLGYVEEVLLDPEGDPEELLVRGASTILVPLSQIRRLVPGQERLLVRWRADRAAHLLAKRKTVSVGGRYPGRRRTTASTPPPGASRSSA